MLIADVSGLLKVACEWRFAAENGRVFIFLIFFITNFLQKVGNKSTTNHHHLQHIVTTMPTMLSINLIKTNLCGLRKSDHPQLYSLNLYTITGERYWCHLCSTDNVMIHSMRNI